MKYNLIILTIISLAACNSESKDSVDKTTKKNMAEDTSSLQDILNKKKYGFNAQADSIKKQVYAEGIQAVIDAKITKNALQIGSIFQHKIWSFTSYL